MNKETSDGTAAKDWERVHEAALGIANAADSDIEEASRRMVALLSELEQWCEPASYIGARRQGGTDPSPRYELLRWNRTVCRVALDASYYVVVDLINT